MINIIKAPLVTEKNTVHSAAGVYVFEVELRSSKSQVKDAVERYFKVRVDSVRTSICRGHSKNSKFGPTSVPYWKKAYVKLVEGDKIALFEGV